MLIIKLNFNKNSNTKFHVICINGSFIICHACDKIIKYKILLDSTCACVYHSIKLCIFNVLLWKRFDA